MKYYQKISRRRRKVKSTDCSGKPSDFREITKANEILASENPVL